MVISRIEHYFIGRGIDHQHACIYKNMQIAFVDLNWLQHMNSIGKNSFTNTRCLIKNCVSFENKKIANVTYAVSS